MEPAKNRPTGDMKITGDLKKPEIDDILMKERVCRIAFVNKNEPYVLPLFYGYDGEYLYVHSSARGRKMDILKRNRRVCFQVSSDVEIVEDINPCRWYARYRSVIGWGNAELIEDREEKREALSLITERYYGKKAEFSDEELRKLAIIKIKIDRMTGKTRM